MGKAVEVNFFEFDFLCYLKVKCRLKKENGVFEWRVE